MFGLAFAKIRAPLRLTPFPGLPLRKSKPLTNEAQAFRYALWLLTRRPHGSGELEEKFRRGTLPVAIQEAVLARLEAKKFVNDRDFAERFVLSKRARNWGPGKIRAGLNQKRISRETIDKTTASLFSSADEKEQAKELLSRQKQKIGRAH